MPSLASCSRSFDKDVPEIRLESGSEKRFPHREKSFFPGHYAVSSGTSFACPQRSSRRRRNLPNVNQRNGQHPNRVLFRNISNVTPGSLSALRPYQPNRYNVNDVVVLWSTYLLDGFSLE